MRLHEMNKDERDANMLHMGVILASLRAVPSVRATLKAELRATGNDMHGALARRVLLGCYRDELEDEQVERARLLERLFDGTFGWRSSPDQVQRYCDEIIRVNRGLGDDDGHYSPSKLAMRLRSLVPTATVREEWDDARRDLVQANTLTDPVAVIVAIQNSLVPGRPRLQRQHPAFRRASYRPRLS